MTASPARERPRNATQTRQLLLDVARHRFARHGYASTTVREIADGAGVNVALINRYFTSKEGLFQACLQTAIIDLKRDTDGIALADVAASIAYRLTSPADDPALLDALLLLVRSSGDERVDAMRRTVLHSMSERLAVAAGAPQPPDADAVLRAQIVLAASLGVALMRASVGLQPLASATEAQMRGPISDLVSALT
ncbi:TetR/AcrR family transcriptional regulator [Actinoplanes sp. NBC_00393]|uniref:TetR/AcrR family transcriptional regulator n=1 Tax=Actinoplanes sp. NBC_00393 TaxID=2975953 RepID=UPI002E222F11